MGDRGNIKVVAGDSEVFLYTHWHGSDLSSIVKKSLSTERARNRWNDAFYLARILFQDLVGDDTSEYGYGISSVIGDGEDQVFIVDVENQKVQWKDGLKSSFENFTMGTGFKSSAVEELSYKADGTLKVQFTSSNIKYTFKNVPIEVYEEFVAAKSKGKFFAHNIRGKYQADEEEYA